MSDPDDEPRQWDELVSHLVQAHGAEPGRLTAFVPTLGQARFIHLDTHAALSIAGQLPPDGHAPPAPENPRSLHPLSSDYTPFPASPSAMEDGAYTYARRHESWLPAPDFTSLPQTQVRPAADADLDDWPSAAMRILLETWATYGGAADAAEAAVQIRESIRTDGGAEAAGRWQAVTTVPVAPEFTEPPPHHEGCTTWQTGHAAGLRSIPRLAAESFPEPGHADCPCEGSDETPRRAPQPGPRVNRKRR
jgi:hypothetical protein